MNQDMECSAMLSSQSDIGWHLRPAGLLVSVASMFESEIIVKCGRRIASAKSLLGILTLGAGRGAQLYVSARGRDAQMAIKAIKAKFAAAPEPGEPSPSEAFARPIMSVANTKEDPMSKRFDLSSGPAPRKPVVKATFRCALKPDAKRVYLAGDFNHWDTQAVPMTRRGGKFSKSLELAPGQYQYKYFIDGEWCADPDAPLAVSEVGSINNIINV